MIELTPEQKDILAKARSTYGSTTQILVSVEELAELTCVCAKYPRYADANEAREQLHAKALDEVADVIIVLDHIINTFELTDDELRSRIAAKVSRVGRWLSESDDIHQSTVDRDVCEQSESDTTTYPKEWCSECVHANKPGFEVPCINCLFTAFEDPSSKENTPMHFVRRGGAQ